MIRFINRLRSNLRTQTQKKKRREEEDEEEAWWDINEWWKLELRKMMFNTVSTVQMQATDVRYVTLRYFVCSWKLPFVCVCVRACVYTWNQGENYSDY